MCAIPDKATTEEFRKRKGRQRAYKVLRKSSARPYYYLRSPAYSPGANVDRRAVKTYAGYIRGCQRGLHCYLNRNDAVHRRDTSCFCEYAVVCVTFDPSDVIAAEAATRRYNRQIVVRALHISNHAWKQAGLPATKGGAA